MTAHRVRRTAGAAALVLLAPLLALALPAPAQALHQSVTLNLNGTTTQLGRIFRDGVPSTCGAPKAFPGAAAAGTTLNYATTTFVAPTSGCLTVSRSEVSCDSGNVHLVAYLADYHPAFQEGHYLGDQGSSTDADTLAIDVQKGRSYVIAATNVSTQAACSVKVTFDLADDTTAPDTAFVKAPPLKVRDSSVALAFTGTAGDTAGFQCQVDGAAYTACASPLQLDGLTPGGHTVAVRAVDDAGNADATPATATFLSCDLAGGTLALEKAEATRASATKALAKAKAAVRKAKTPQARKKAKKKLATATKAATAAKAQVTTIEQGLHSCAS